MRVFVTQSHKIDCASIAHLFRATVESSHLGFVGILLAEIVPTYREQYPDVTIDVQIRSDRCFCAGSEIREAVSELIENAVKHNTSPDPRVVVTVDSDDGWVVLSIEDNGPGIDEMEANVISKGREHALEHGSGLGLWLVNWIATRYGGSFQIQSDRDGRSRATMRLPRMEEGQSVEAAAKRPTILSW